MRSPASRKASGQEGIVGRVFVSRDDGVLRSHLSGSSMKKLLSTNAVKSTIPCIREVLWYLHSLHGYGRALCEALGLIKVMMLRSPAVIRPVKFPIARH